MGQTLRQFIHLVHFSLSIVTLNSETIIASAGQTATQVPQISHRSGFIFTAAPLFFIHELHEFHELIFSLYFL